MPLSSSLYSYAGTVKTDGTVDEIGANITGNAVDEDYEKYVIYKAALLSASDSDGFKIYYDNLNNEDGDISVAALNDTNWFEDAKMQFLKNDMGWKYFKDPKVLAENELSCRDVYFGMLLKILKEGESRDKVIQTSEAICGAAKEMGDSLDNIEDILDFFDDTDDLYTVMQNNGYNSMTDFINEDISELVTIPSFNEFLGKNVNFKIKSGSTEDTLGDIEKGLKSVEQLLRRIYNAKYIGSMKEAYEPAIKQLRELASEDDDSNRYLIAALDGIEKCMENPTYDYLPHTARISGEMAFDYFWGGVMGTVEEAYPAAKIVSMIFNTSGAVIEMLTNKDKYVDTKYECMAMAHIKMCARVAYLRAVNNFRRNPTIENAESVIAMYDFVKKCAYADLSVASSHVKSMEGNVIKYWFQKKDIESFLNESIPAIKNSLDYYYGQIDDYCDDMISTNRPEMVKYLGKSKKSKGGFRYTAACPVDIYVESDRGAARIVGNLMHSDGSIALNVDGDRKVVYMGRDDDAKITISGNGTGNMDFLVEELDGDGFIISQKAYLDVPITTESRFMVSAVHSQEGDVQDDTEKVDELYYEDGEEVVSFRAAANHLRLKNAHADELTEAEEGEYNVCAGTKLWLTADVPIGYEFKGWKCHMADDEGRSIDDVFSDLSSEMTYFTMPNADVRVEAECVRVKDTYRINATCSEGGSLNVAENVTVQEGDALNIRMDPAEGYVLDGITVDGVEQETDGVYGFTNISSDHTFHASFVKEDTYYTVSFDSCGGSDVVSQSVSENGHLAEPAAPTYQGRTFKGWYREPEGVNKWDFEIDTVDGDLTLYADWEEDGQEGTNPPETNPGGDENDPAPGHGGDEGGTDPGQEGDVTPVPGGENDPDPDHGGGDGDTTVPANPITDDTRDDDKKSSSVSEQYIETIVPITRGGILASSKNDNFAAEAGAGKVNKLVLNFANVDKSTVSANKLKLTVVKGSKLITAERVRSASGDGGIKVKVNKKTGLAVITPKSSGGLTVTTERGRTYRVAISVETPKAQKAVKKQGINPKKTLTLTIRDLFNTTVDGGRLTVGNAGQASVSGNSLIIKPKTKETIKVTYQFINKKYKTTIKIR